MPDNDILEKGQQTIISQLTKKSSTEIKYERKLQMVDFIEINNICYALTFIEDKPYAYFYNQIGLSSRAYKDDSEKNQARKVTKYALLGLLAEKRKINQHTFSSTELSIIFSALTQHIETRAKPFQEEVINLRKIIMNLILNS
jgi:GH25 family lysozyme M1 (1,4-beta-N-acetylmuramidase)